uniref:GOLD domain-containing protein n=1 Tax=Acrobeloides nanus TaxID=290746 RepID=A0A914CVA3_9BILA
MRTLIALLAVLAIANAIELIFELSANSDQCFYEDFKDGIDTAVKFQLITDGEIDVTIEDPSEKTLFQILQSRGHKFEFKTEINGSYKLCFKNRFSTVSHAKVVYMEWVSGDQTSKFNRIKQEDLGRTRSSVPAMHDSLDHLADRLKTFENFQTHQRIREAIGRKRMENLANFVSYSSIWNIVLILIVGLGEVYLVRSFFNDEKSAAYMKSARRAFRSSVQHVYQSRF